MNRRYTLKSGEVIDCWYNDLGSIEVYTDKRRSNGVRFDFDSQETDPTFEWHGETVHINDFDYQPVDTLLERIQHGIDTKNYWEVSQEEALATIMKDTDNVGFVMDIDCFDTIIPGLGFAFKSNHGGKIRALLIPFEDRYKKKDWHYKIELHAENEKVRELTGRECTYFSDIWDAVRRGQWITLVNRHKYRAEHPEDTVINDGTITIMNCPI